MGCKGALAALNHKKGWRFNRNIMGCKATCCGIVSSLGSDLIGT